MKTFQNIFKVLMGVCLLGLSMVSCLPEQESMGGAGQTLIKYTPADFALIALDAKTTSQQADMFIVRKDAHNETALNTQTVVVLKKDDALLTKYNTDNGTSFVPLPTTLGTTSPAPGSDGNITLTFAPGDAAKVITVTIPNASTFDFSKQYALAYKMTSVTGVGTISQAYSDVIVVQVLVKNKYDGIYTVTAISPMVDILNATLTGYYPFTYELETSGAASCKCYDSEVYGDYMHPITSGTSVSGYGSFGLEVFFDATTNKIIDVKNPWGNPPSNTRMPAIDPSGTNSWNPATKTILFKYWMKQPSVVTAAPNIRVYFDEKWAYKSAR
jgi:hypothetical protein